MKRKMIIALIIPLVLFSVNHSVSAENHHSKRPSAGAVVADAIVLRPLGFCGTVLGAAAFVISLPVTVPTKKTDAVSRTLVRKPYSYTFERPLGKM